MFVPGKLYRFKANKDVGFEVVKAFYVPDRDRWNLKVSWINIGTHAPWYMGITQRINVPGSKLAEVQQISSTFRVPAEEFAPIYY